MKNFHNFIIALKRSIRFTFIEYQMIKTDTKYIKGKLTEDQYLAKMNILNIIASVVIVLLIIFSVFASCLMS